MLTYPVQTRSPVANAVYALLNPIPFGFFVAALIFDVVYARSGEILWVKSAAWLITLGLLSAVVPRLVNLVHVWRRANRADRAEKLDFWLNLFAIAAAILNAFVHSRDAYAAIPEGVWLSVATVILLSLGAIIVAVSGSVQRGVNHG